MSTDVMLPAGGIHSRVTVEHVAEEDQRLRVEYSPARTDVLPVSGTEFTVPEQVIVHVGDMSLRFTCEQWRVLIRAVEAVLPEVSS